MRSWVRIFHPRIERANLWLGFGFLAMAVLQPVLWPGLNGEWNIQNLIDGILFFNVLHVMITFVNCIFVREYRTVIRERVSGTDILGLSAFVFAILLIAKLGLVQSPWIQGPIAHFLLFAPIFHGIRQTTGLSLLYNQTYIQSQHLSAERLQRLTACYRLEKRASALFVFASYLCALTIFPAAFRFGLSPTPFIYVGLTLLISSLVLLIAAIVRLGDRNLILPKLLFNTRTLARSLFPVSSYAAFHVAPSLHGSEYALLQCDLLTRFRRSVVARILLMLFPLFILKISLDYSGWISNSLGVTVSDQTTAVLASLGLVLTYVHYYLDSVLFRMSDPLCRKEVGSLLLRQTAERALPPLAPGPAEKEIPLAAA